MIRSARNTVEDTCRSVAFADWQQPMAPTLQAEERPVACLERQKRGRHFDGPGSAENSMPFEANLSLFRGVWYVRRYAARYRRPDRLPWSVAFPFIVAVSLVLWAGSIALCVMAV